jgi:hypothetical protein
MMRRAYTGLGEFPVWFFNLTPAKSGDIWPDERDRPPGARTGMIVSGFLDVAHPGVLQFDVTPDMTRYPRAPGSGMGRHGVRPGIDPDVGCLDGGAHRFAHRDSLDGRRVG